MAQKINQKQNAHVPDDEPVSGSDYANSESESEDEQASAVQDSLVYSTHHLYLSDSSISTVPGDDSDSGSDSDSDSPVGGVSKRIGKAGRSDSTTSFESVDEAWHREASTSLFTAMENDHPAEVANLELNGLRMTANANFSQVRRAVTAALVNRIEQVVAKESISNGASASKVLQRWESTIKRCVFNRKDQAEFLLLFQRECCGRKAGESILLGVVQCLNNTMDIVEEEAVNDWWLDERSSQEEKMAAVRKPTEAFVNWLAEAESESESEEGDDDETDEDEDDG